MPLSNADWQADNKSPGSAGSMNSPVRSWVPAFSPWSAFGQVPVADIRTSMRQQFRIWGLPKAVRVDNGVPWGNWNDLPTAFALWLIGLGIEIYWNDPCRPQQNPKIERSQGTGKRWGEPSRCHSVAELQANLDEADHIQREKYPAAGGASRLELFPGVRHSGHRYTLAWEDRTWSLAMVETHLAEYVVRRKVVASGHVSIYDHGRYVGKQFEGQFVEVQYDPDRHQWLIADREGRELRRHPAPEITTEHIHKLNFRKKRNRS
jgi:hypothetical protein